MTGELRETDIRCPNCGAELPANAAYCPSCGHPVETVSEEEAESLAEGTTGSNGELKLLVVESDQNLFKRGADAAEAAFSMGCSLGVILSGLLLVIVFLSGVRNWIILGLVAFGATVLTTGVSAFLALQARANARKRAYENTVVPQINRYLQSHQMTRKEFDALAYELIPGESPLQAFITPPEQQERLETEE
jgi:hypothetical protein